MFVQFAGTVCWRIAKVAGIFEQTEIAIGDGLRFKVNCLRAELTEHKSQQTDKGKAQVKMFF